MEERPSCVNAGIYPTAGPAEVKFIRGGCAYFSLPPFERGIMSEIKAYKCDVCGITITRDPMFTMEQSTGEYPVLTFRAWRKYRDLEDVCGLECATEAITRWHRQYEDERINPVTSEERAAILADSQSVLEKVEEIF
jgi:hypothetical protein